MSKVAVIGIAGESVFMTVDSFGEVGQTSVATSFHNELGGKGFNQAVACARYGAEVSFLCACHVSDVQNFTNVAKGKGINALFIGKNERSPYAVITTDKKGDNSVLVYHGAELSVDDVKLFADKIMQADVLLINNEVPISVNELAVKIAKENGVKVIFNPAPYRENPKDFLDKIDLFTPNEHEYKGLEQYVNVVVTKGDKGCYIKSLDKIVPPKKVKAVDTTGAGDSFSGVLATCIAQSEDILSACEKASIASAIKVTRRYILNSIPTKEEIEKFKE